nr:cation transporter [Microvirga makkahensis]
MTAGFLSGSAALVSRGFDSNVEGASAGAMIWRLHGEEREISPHGLTRRKKTALSVVAAAFWIVVAFILYEAVSTFIAQKAPAFSWLGIGILVVALVVNPVLAWGKYHYGKKLDAKSLKYDANDTLICQYQTVVVLAGLILTETMGWWWADPVATLVIVSYIAWEGVEAARDAWRVDPDEAGMEAQAA